jgi:predicted GIY-YIG superfamily endonuclease
MLLRTLTCGVSKIKMTIVQDVSEQDTYNLTVADCHTYFVGKEGVLVHNQDTKNGKVYIGRDPQENIIYVGQTKQDLLKREKNHHDDAIKKPEIYGYKKDMKLEVVLDGLTDDEMHYHERRIFDQLTEQGIKLRYEQEPMGHAGINKLIEQNC